MGKTAKYIIVALGMALLALAPLCLNAQHYVGVRGGYGGGNGNRFFLKTNEHATLWGLYHGGASWKYYSPEKYVGGVEVDMLFMQQGFKELDKSIAAKYQFPNDTTGYTSRTVNSVMVPLFWQPHVYMFRRNLRIFLNAGLTFSYNISQTYEIGSKENGVFEKGDYKMTNIKDNRWGYGLCGGGGMGYTFGRVEVLAEVRYYINYSDLMKNRNKYKPNPLRSPVDGLQGSVGIYWRFGRKGILSPPSKGMERRLRELEEKRLARETGIPVTDEVYIPEGLSGVDTEVLPVDETTAGN